MKPHNGTRDLPEPRQDILDRAGENPLRFLAMPELDTSLGLIRGMRDLDRLEAWREAEMEHVDPPRDRILNALREREKKLTGEATEREPEPASVDPDQTEREPEPAQAHEDVSAVLDVGSVLVYDRGERIEYIWPASARADTPYLAQEYEEDTVRMEVDVDLQTVKSRRRNNAEVRQAADVSVEPPVDALTEVDNCETSTA